MSFDREAAAAWCDAVWGRHEGRAVVAYGSNGHYQDGRYEFGRGGFVQVPYMWPAEREMLLDGIAQEMAAGKVDVYACPLLRTDAKRRKGNAAHRDLLWVDGDGDVSAELLDALAQFGGYAVNSGTAGHAHVYLPLTESVPAELRERLCKALAAKVGDADAKWADNDVLRVPGTYSHKTDPPAPITWRTSPSGARAAVGVLAELLGVDLTEDGREHTTPGGPPPEAEPVDLASLPPKLRARLEQTNPPDRSAHFHSIVGACKRAGLTQGQAVTVAADWVRRAGMSRYAGREAEEVARCWGKVDDTPRRPADGRPEVNVTNTAVTADWLRENLGTGPLAGMFNRAGTVVHTPREGEEGYIPLTDDAADGPAQVRPVTAGAVASRIQYTYAVYRLAGDPPKAVPAMFPRSAASVAVEVPDMLPNLRSLRGVTHTPVLRRDGTVLTAPGYDPGARLLHLPEPGLTVPEVPDRPTDADVAAARGLLEAMTGDFRFLTDHDRANYYGLLLTPLLREMVPPPYKLGAIGAPQPGSGKTLLATIARIVHGGVFRAEMPEDDAELRKQVTAILDVTTGPVVHFDNVSGTLRSSTLAGLLTSGVWDDRKLGATEMISRPNDRLWVITGNNLSLGGDLVRRTVWVTIDPGVPNPELRTGFAIPNLEDWAREHRGELICALLTLARAWVVAGRPAAPRAGDGFARWVEAVDGILTNAGVPGTFAHADSARQDVGVDDDDWAGFLAAARASFGDRPWTVKELLERVDRAFVPSIPLDALPAELAERIARAGGNVGVATRSLGMWLRNRDGRWAGDLTVRAAHRDAHSKVTYWRVDSVAGSTGSAGSRSDTARDVPGDETGNSPGGTWTDDRKHTPHTPYTPQECAVPGCTQSPRRACLTCAEHMAEESIYAGSAA